MKVMNANKLLKNTVLLSFSFHCWTNTGRGAVDKIETEAEKSRLRIAKKLVDSKELKAISDYQGDVKDWLKIQSVPAFFKNALVLVKIDNVERVEKRLVEAQAEIARLATEFIKAYPAQKDAAVAALGNMYNERDYPTADELRGYFGITWNWIELNVSSNLPEEIRKNESRKLESMWQESIGEIIIALRGGFKDLIDHAIDRLSVAPGEKPKVFRDSLVENFREFVETFNARNVVNDTELATLVEKARKIIVDVDASSLRDDVKLRESVAASFARIKTSVDEAVTTASKRKFRFDD